MHYRVTALPNGWQSCNSTAVEAFRFLPERSVLQVVFREGRTVYDYPCDSLLFARFEAAPSKGRFVNSTLGPHAKRMGWSVRSYRWTSW